MHGTTNNTLSKYMYCASAPGKVILFGEHSVVYGQTAVAAALSDLRIHVCVQAVSRTEGDGESLRIIMKDLPNPVEVSFFMDDFISMFSQITCPPSMDCTNCLETLVRTKAQLGTMYIINDDSIHAILPVLYLVSRLLPEAVLRNFGCSVIVRADNLPVGAGLGSSAAFSVACAAALVQWKYHQLGCNSSNAVTSDMRFPVCSPRTPPSALIAEINEHAYYSEMLLHGRPSGIDNTVSSYGGAVSFIRSHHEVSFDPVPLPDGRRGCSLHLILVNTHVPRQTKKLVAGVRVLYDQYPNIFTPVLEAMGQISKTFCDLMHNEQLDSRKDGDDAVLMLVRTNQALLTSLGVSHSSLDSICDTINGNLEFRSLAAAKLTGAGGGGCAMILLRANTSFGETDAALDELRQKVITTLQKEARPGYQFTFLSSTVGGDGVLFTPSTEFEVV